MTESEWLASTDPGAMLDFWTLRNPAVGNLVVPSRKPSNRKLRLFAEAALGTDEFDNFRGLFWSEYQGGYRLSARVVWTGSNGDADGYYFAESASFVADILRDIVGNPFRPVVLPTEMVWIEVPYEHASDRMIRRCPWLTPLVVSLAAAAYESRLPSGQLDPEQLAVLSDALEDAGCPTHQEIPCPVCSSYKDDPQNPWRAAGYHPERDPASGRHEGGWTNCKACNGGGKAYVGDGWVRESHPLLTHLRSPGPHWRGCWAVDLLLGKE